LPFPSRFHSFFSEEKACAPPPPWLETAVNPFIPFFPCFFRPSPLKICQEGIQALDPPTVPPRPAPPPPPPGPFFSGQPSKLAGLVTPVFTKYIDYNLCMGLSSTSFPDPHPRCPPPLPPCGGGPTLGSTPNGHPSAPQPSSLRSISCPVPFFFYRRSLFFLLRLCSKTGDEITAAYTPAPILPVFPPHPFPPLPHPLFVFTGLTSTPGVTDPFLKRGDQQG